MNSSGRGRGFSRAENEVAPLRKPGLNIVESPKQNIQNFSEVKSLIDDYKPENEESTILRISELLSDLDDSTLGYDLNFLGQ